ncbi:CRISPR-associated helicase Cas3' [Myroides sp. DW712]|uniref:CRISPR-associated helicase Cas3' n=1 Tax=Myroides sp. DW712 TaxID=3389800 RepID=UPI00397B5F33
MSNSYKSIKQLVEEIPSLRTYLQDEGIYYAHIARDKAPETLAEHLDLVNTYFVHLVEEHSLDTVIDRLLSDYLDDMEIEDQLLGEAIKRQFVNAIGFHDHGKVNENFQANSLKMNNPHFYDKGSKDSVLSTNHSLLSAFIYLSKEIDAVARMPIGKERNVLIATAFFLSYSIYKHHSSSLNDTIEETLEMRYLFINRDRAAVLDFLASYLAKYGFNVSEKIVSCIGNTQVINSVFKTNADSEALYSLVKLNFSLLTASDYLATNEYNAKMKLGDVFKQSVFTPARINQLYTYVTQSEKLGQTKVNFNAITYRALEDYTIKNPREQSGQNLNILRKEMGIEVIQNIRKYADRNLFYIEAPTGGGKTNLSVLAMLELLKASEGKLNKVFYVFPFTTLITQTKKSLIETLGLEENEIVELHSKAAFTEKGNGDVDGRYGNNKLNFIANLFVHYPMCLLSHIGFFDLLKSNKKEKNYSFHRLANAVVVIDELQSYSPQHWEKVIYFITHYAKAFNIKFILMSATLPKLDKLNFLKEGVGDFVYLLPEAKDRYFRNPNFCQRITFDFEYFEKKVELSVLAERLLEESKQYATLDYGEAKPKASVYTIIEFIYKKTATVFYELIKDNDFFDQVFVLSGTILEHRRQYIIDFLKQAENRSKKILLITTQVVEAGVDIDMDLGFKNRSILDSDEQLAGRINRNVNKGNCKLFLFNYDQPCVIYGKDLRFKLTKEKLQQEQYKQILETKDFDLLYDLVINNRNKWSETPMVSNIKEYVSYVKKMRFESINKEFQLIESKNISCFVPLIIPVTLGKNIFFTYAELAFLKEYGIVENNGGISGVEVFDLYLAIIQYKIDFLSQRTREKQLQSILSKYVFSVFATKIIEEQLVRFSDVDKSAYGYQYLAHWNDFYTIEGGMDTSKLHGIEENQFL